MHTPNDNPEIPRPQNSPFILDDPMSGRRWRIPRRRIRYLNTDMSERWVGTAIIPKQLCEFLVPPQFLRPLATEQAIMF